MSSISSISTLSNSSHHGNNKNDILYHLAKAISDDRCLLDKVSHFENKNLTDYINLF